MQGDPISIQENRVFKIHRYGHDYPEFADQELSAGDPIELNPSSNHNIRYEFNSAIDWIIKAYPIPINKLLSIEITLPEMATIEITSLNGELLINEKMEGTVMQLDLSSLQKGVYFITMRFKDFATTKKIIKL